MILSLLFIFILSANPSFADLVSEQEPNDEIGNACACGDTVVCANLSSPTDVDHFRFWSAEGDSIHLLTYDCDGSNTNTFMVLYDDNWNVLAVNDNGGPQFYSRINFAGSANAFYVCRVMYAGNGICSTYNLAIGCFDPPPEEYDYCTTPRIVNFFPYYDEGTTIGMSNDAGSAAPDVFYKFHNPSNEDVAINVCTETFDARVQILGSCIGDFMDDTDQGCFDGASMTSYGLPEGDYYVMVEGTSQFEMGNFSIEIGPDFPECPAPENLVIYAIAGQPFLDWDNVPDAWYYVVYSAQTGNQPFEHLDTTFVSFYSDPAGFAASSRMYRVTTVCPWGE